MPRAISARYILAVAVAFAYFYPILASLLLVPAEYERRMWLASW